MTMTSESGEVSGCRPATATERTARRLARLAWLPGRGIARALYARALVWRTGGRGVACTLPGGEVVRLWPAYRHTTWNLDEYAAFRRALTPGQIAIDVGASLGAYALLFGQWVGETGRVYAFEPAPIIADGLERHVALNGLASTVAVVRAAVADRTSSAGFIAPGLHAINRLAHADEAAPGAIEVRTTSLDDFCAEAGIEPDLVKIDVEGTELAVLRGARNTIRRAGGRLALFVELHPSLWPGCGITRADVEDELRRLGLVARPLRAGADVWSQEGVVVRLEPA